MAGYINAYQLAKYYIWSQNIAHEDYYLDTHPSQIYIFLKDTLCALSPKLCFYKRGCQLKNIDSLTKLFWT